MSSEKKNKLMIGAIIALTIAAIDVYFMFQKNIDIFIGISVLVVLLVGYWLFARSVVAKKTTVRISKSEVGQSGQSIFNALGDKDNIVSVDHCQTRVKVTVKDSSLVDVDKIRKAGIQGVIKPSNTMVHLVAKEMVTPLYETLKERMK